MPWCACGAGNPPQRWPTAHSGRRSAGGKGTVCSSSPRQHRGALALPPKCSGNALPLQCKGQPPRNSKQQPASSQVHCSPSRGTPPPPCVLGGGVTAQTSEGPTPQCSGVGSASHRMAPCIGSPVHGCARCVGSGWVDLQPMSGVWRCMPRHITARHRRTVHCCIQKLPPATTLLLPSTKVSAHLRGTYTNVLHASFSEANLSHGGDVSSIPVRDPPPPLPPPPPGPPGPLSYQGSMDISHT